MIIKDIYIGLKLSISYFSTIPIKFSKNDNLTEKIVLNFMLFFLPLVGGVIAFLAFGLYTLMDALSWYGAFVASMSYILLYGFLHIEAVIDTVDGLYALHSGKNPYEVIKEPTVGAMGVVFGMSLLIFKVVSTTYLFLQDKGIFLIIVAVSSRISLLILFRIMEFHSTLLDRLKSSFSQISLYLAIALYSILVYLLSGFGAILILTVAITFGIFIANRLKNRLGFINGDLMGTVLELVESSTIFGIIIFITTPKNII